MLSHVGVVTMHCRKNPAVLTLRARPLSLLELDQNHSSVTVASELCMDTDALVRILSDTPAVGFCGSRN